jgi:hypothetical protein
MYVEPWMFYLLLGSIVLHLWLSTPVSSAERAEKHERWQRNRDALAVQKAQRQAWRREVFGSHPVLYWGLAWLGAPVALCLSVAVISALMGH